MFYARLWNKIETFVVNDYNKGDDKLITKLPSEFAIDRCLSNLILALQMIDGESWMAYVNMYDKLTPELDLKKALVEKAKSMNNEATMMALGMKKDDEETADKEIMNVYNRDQLVSRRGIDAKKTNIKFKGNAKGKIEAPKSLNKK